MTTKEIQIIKTNIKAQLADKSIAPLFLSGVPGTAKSQSIANLADELDMNLLDVSAPTLSTEILSGLPTEYRATQFNKYTIIDEDVYGTKWSIPEMIANANKLAQDKPTILLIDDFHMVGAHLQAYFYKLLLQRMIGNYRLDDNVVILGTLNNSDSAGFSGINSAVRNRMSILNVEFNFEYWFENFGRYIDYRVSSFLKAKPHHTIEEESTGIEGYASARAWTSISKELKYHDPEFILANAAAIANTQVSREAANAFGKHVQFINSINFEKVVSSREMVDISSKDLVEQFTYQYISNFISTVEDGKYLLELCDLNHNNSSFIGFLLGDINYKYSNNESITDGLKFVVDILIGETPSANTYTKTTQKKLDKVVSETTLSHGDEILTLASKYLI